jgi:hypothetical protein
LGFFLIGAFSKLKLVSFKPEFPIFLAVSGGLSIEVGVSIVVIETGLDTSGYLRESGIIGIYSLI